MAKFTSGHGLHYFLPQSYISKRTIFGSKPWLYCELALDWASDVVPSAPFCPKGHIPGNRSASERTLSLGLRKRMICIIHSQQVAIPANFVFCKGTHGRRRQAPWTLQAQTHVPQFYTNASCSFRLLFKELRSGIPPQASTYCTSGLLPDPSIS